jgi:hypothetical protein
MECDEEPFVDEIFGFLTRLAALPNPDSFQTDADMSGRLREGRGNNSSLVSGREAGFHFG